MTSHATSPTAAENSLRIDTRSLARTPGASMSVSSVAELPERIGVEMVRLPAGTELQLDLDLTCVDEGILVTGHVAGDAEMECARCLGVSEVPVDLDLTEMYAYPGTAAAEAADDDAVRLAEGDIVDLLPSLVDGFGLDFPLAPTCEEFGGHPCVEESTPPPDGVSGEETGRVDPRFAELAERFGLDPNAPATGEDS